MKNRYEFMDREISEVEVAEEIGSVIVESRRLEDNLARKEATIAIRWMQWILRAVNMLVRIPQKAC